MRSVLRSLALSALGFALLSVAIPAGLPCATAGPVPRTRARPRARAAALVQTLKKQTVSTVNFEEVTFKDAIKWLRVVTGQNFVVKQTALRKASIDTDEIRYTVKLEGVSVVTLLDVLLTDRGMAALVKGNVVYITSKQDSYGKPFTKIYSISHITWQRVDFAGPPMDLRPSGFVETQEYEPEVIDESDVLTDPDLIIEHIKKLVDPQGWENAEGWSISGTKRYLVVRAPVRVHRKMLRALDHIASMK